MKKLILFLTALIVLGAGGYFFYRHSQADVPQVKTVEVKRDRIETKVYATGTIDMANKQEVTLFKPGLVTSVAVSVGSQVKKGDLLFQLDTTDIDLQIKQAQAAVDVARANAASASAKLTELQQANQAPPVNAGGLPGQPGAASGMLTGSVDDAKNAVLQAQAAVKQAEASLAVVQSQKNQAKITASIAGTVLQVNVDPNQMAAPQVPLVVVGDLSHLIVEADINQVDASKLAPGQTVKIAGATLADKQFSGKVTSVAPMAETQPTAQGSQTTVQVKFSVDQSDPALKPGYSVNLTVVTAVKDNVLQVPLEAVITADSDKYVYAVKNGFLHKAKVVTGIVGDINMEVTSGLEAGDLVVLNPSNDLSEGMKVKVE